MKQIEFEWAKNTEAGEPAQVVLEPATTDAVMELIARALIAVVRVTQETADER